MWFIQPRQDYVAQMPWRHADEPAVMSWQIRTRDYNTFVANFAFLAIVVLTSGWGALFGYMLFEPDKPESMTFSLYAGAGMSLFGILIGMSMTHQTAIIVYRFTERGGEVCSWKPQIDSVKPVMKWTAIVSGVGVVVLGLAFVEPAVMIAGIAPLGLGLMAALAGTSKSYESLVRNAQHYDLYWPEAAKIHVFRKREIIGLNIHWYNPDVGKQITTTIQPVFCRKGELDERLAFFRQRLPEVPVVEEAFEVYH